MGNRDEMILQNFADHVSAIRAKKKLSLSQVAAKCKLTNTKISLVENGRVNVTLMTIIELAEGLGVSPKQLLDFEYRTD
jgi:transcriptional regulator with XRE-family HTH domain